MGRFAQGRYTLKNPEKFVGNKAPIYRSSWEFTFMQFCDNNPAITQWASESIKIPYRNPLTGRQTIYVPDFFIAYGDKSGKQKVELIEIKPANQTHKSQLGKSKHNQAHWIVNQAKWEAASAWCKQKSITFRILNENDIYHNGKRSR
tara:strand:+ start:680 stop:1120 length:441 start_codon:yes stop_codon:yes gene_type:complete